MNNIFFNYILPLVIIMIFLGILIYLIFFKHSELKESFTQKYNPLYNAHVSESSIPAEEVFKLLKDNNIDPEFLK